LRGNFDDIYNDLRKKILDGDLKRGVKLPSLSKLSDEYKVGVSTTREALRALQSQSLVKIEQGRGSFIIYSSEDTHAVSREKVRELLDLARYRTMIEPSFAATAAIQAFQNEIDQIVESAARMVSMAEKGENTKEEDMKFHLFIVQATHNPFAIKFYEDLQDELKEGRQHTNVPDMIEKAGHYHSMIADAIKTRNSSQAKMYMQAHMESNEELALEMLFSNYN